MRGWCWLYQLSGAIDIKIKGLRSSSMPSFIDTFWSDDLQSGLDVLFSRLYHGCDQCDLYIQMFASRMQYEVGYGKQLAGIRTNIDGLDTVMHSNSTEDPNTGDKSDESHSDNKKGRWEPTTVVALSGMLDQMVVEGKQHIMIASNIETMVLQPFSKWCTEHRERVKFSESLLSKNVKNFKKSRIYVKKLENDYFSKCRALEDFKNENFNDEELAAAMRALKIQKKYISDREKEKDNQIFIKLNTLELDHKSTREIIIALLKDLPKSEFRVPLINYTLNNTNSGREITDFLKTALSIKDLDETEAFGQELLNLGFIKYCNGVGTTFVNSKKFQYQWKPYAYKYARLSYSDGSNNVLSSSLTKDFENNVSTYLQDMTTKISQRAVSNETNGSPNVNEKERIFFKLLKEMEDADNKYYKEAFKMDSLRCSVEELVIDHLSFMEKCESDRLKAIKKATLDFCSTMGNKITSLKLSSEKLLDFEDSIDPSADMLALLTNYHTGVFHPRAITYNNYYNPGSFQNFGIDLETRCRLDKKVVPLIISAVLTYMDSVYPDMINDKIRTLTWISPVKLNSTHQLRSLLNKRQFSDEKEILELLKVNDVEASTVASIVKLYLLELPQPLIPKDLSEVLSELYIQFPLDMDKSGDNENCDNELQVDENKHKRITGLFTILSSLSKTHLATLDSIATHFHRLIMILKMGDNKEDIASTFTDSISQEFASCIIQASTVEDNDLGYKIFYDLLTNKEHIFSNLKRQGSKKDLKSHSK